MAIDPKEINSIEESMVHDADEDPSKITGWAVYLTLRFVSKAILVSYGVMLLAMLGLQMGLRSGGSMPISLRPESLLFALPIVLVAVYLYLVGEAEPVLEAKRTLLGRATTYIGVFLILQVVSVLLWIVTAQAFSLQ